MEFCILKRGKVSLTLIILYLTTPNPIWWNATIFSKYRIPRSTLFNDGSISRSISRIEVLFYTNLMQIYWVTPPYGNQYRIQVNHGLPCCHSSCSEWRTETRALSVQKYLCLISAICWETDWRCLETLHSASLIHGGTITIINVI